jgi:hypothetical protein
VCVCVRERENEKERERERENASGCASIRRIRSRCLPQRKREGHRARET